MGQSVCTSGSFVPAEFRIVVCNCSQSFSFYGRTKSTFSSTYSFYSSEYSFYNWTGTKTFPSAKRSFARAVGKSYCGRILLQRPGAYDRFLPSTYGLRLWIGKTRSVGHYHGRRTVLSCVVIFVVLFRLKVNTAIEATDFESSFKTKRVKVWRYCETKMELLRPSILTAQCDQIKENSLLL